MYNYKKILILLLVLTLGLFLTACGSSSSGSTIDDAINSNYSLDVSTEGQGEINLEPEKSSYKENSTVELSAIPDAGWTFNSWEGGIESKNSSVELIMDSDYNIKSVFTLEEFLFSSTTPENNEGNVSAEIENIYIYFNNDLGINGKEASRKVTINPAPDFYPGWAVEENYIKISLLSGILDFEQTYNIKVNQVWDVDGNTTSDSINFSFTVESDTYPPEAPSLGISTETNDVTLEWNTVYDNPSDGPRLRKIDSYNVYRKKNDNNYSKIANISEGTTTFTDSNLNSGVYNYYVTALDSYDNESSQSNEVSATIN